MARRVQPPGRVAGLAALALGLVWMSAATSQPPDNEKSPPPTGNLPVPDAGTTLYLVVRTKPDVQDSQVIDTFQAGLAASGHSIEGRPILKPVSPSFFEQFAELIGSAPPREQKASPLPGKIALNPLPSRGGQVVEVQLPSPKQTLTKFSVRYQSSPGQKDVEEYIPGQPGSGPLTLIEPGRYALRLPAGRVPVDFTATYDERNNQTGQLERGKEIKDKWPEWNKFYVVTMRNFRSTTLGARPNHERFLQVVEKQNVDAPNPIQISRLGGDQLFVFADMASEGAEDIDDVEIRDHFLHLRRRGLPKRNTRRVWMLLPLSEKEYQEALKKYEYFPTKELPNEIRKNAAQVDDSVLLTPNTPAKWYELPPDPANPTGMFHRVLKMDNVPGLAAKFPEMWQLTVWEYERKDSNGETVREAILVKNPDGKNASTRGGRIIRWSNVVNTVNPPK